MTPPQPTAGRPWRVEIAFLPGARDARGDGVTSRALRDLGIRLRNTETRDVYLLDCDLSADEVERVARAIEDPVVQRAWVGAAPAEEFTWALEVGFKPGVTDNVGRTAKVAIEDLLGRRLADTDQVYAATSYLLRADVDRGVAERIAVDLLANPLIQRTELRSWAEWCDGPPSVEVPRAIQLAPSK